MGQKLVDFYNNAETLGGIQAKIRLATLTRLTSTQAATEPDGAEVVRKFETAWERVKNEFGGEQKSAAVREAKTSAEALRHYNRVCVDLMSQRELFLGDVGRTIARVTEAAAHTLEVTRASIWFYDSARTLIRCADLFEALAGKHSSGTELFAKDFPSYFKALEAERTIAAHDAHTDPRTAVFSAPYLTPLGINAMLDVPIWLEGKMVGVICHEHTGKKRVWTPDEENFAFMLANFVALALEMHRLRNGQSWLSDKK